MPLIKGVLEKAVAENRISRQEWELIIEHATQADQMVRDGENLLLFHLVSLLEGGAVTVDGVPQTEVLRRLAVFI